MQLRFGSETAPGERRGRLSGGGEECGDVLHRPRGSPVFGDGPLRACCSPSLSWLPASSGRPEPSPPGWTASLSRPLQSHAAIGEIYRSPKASRKRIHHRYCGETVLFLSALTRIRAVLTRGILLAGSSGQLNVETGIPQMALDERGVTVAIQIHKEPKISIGVAERNTVSLEAGSDTKFFSISRKDEVFAIKTVFAAVCGLASRTLDSSHSGATGRWMAFSGNKVVHCILPRKQVSVHRNHRQEAGNGLFGLHSNAQRSVVSKFLVPQPQGNFRGQLLGFESNKPGVLDLFADIHHQFPHAVVRWILKMGLMKISLPLPASKSFSNLLQASRKALSSSEPETSHARQIASLSSLCPRELLVLVNSSQTDLNSSSFETLSTEKPSLLSSKQSCTSALSKMCSLLRRSSSFSFILLRSVASSALIPVERGSILIGLGFNQPK
ncbi:hypothetical protein HWI79_3686 [Cryptosporidium felis]|nr:hypothetical protein HWI79_3686 [Cryptosporidium felis]